MSNSQSPAAVLLRPNGGLNRHLVADFPMEPLRRFPADDGAGPRLQPRLFLLRRKDYFGMHVQKFLRHHGILHEEILRVLVNAAEPGLVRRQRHAGNPLHARLVAFRQHLDDGHLVPHHQPVLAGHADPARQRLFDRHQKTEQHERHQNRKQRQRRPQLLPLQIAPDEVEEFHGDGKAGVLESIVSNGVMNQSASSQHCNDSSTPLLRFCYTSLLHFTGSLLSWPLSRYTVRDARAEACGSCVTMMMVLPCSRFSA